VPEFPAYSVRCWRLRRCRCSLCTFAGFSDDRGLSERGSPLFTKLDITSHNSPARVPPSCLSTWQIGDQGVCRRRLIERRNLTCLTMLQTSLRGGVAGAAATVVMTLEQPLDKRLF
jgi:hypothetical protein